MFLEPSVGNILVVQPVVTVPQSTRQDDQGYETVRHETTNSILLLVFSHDGTTNRQVAVLPTCVAVSLPPSEPLEPTEEFGSGRQSVLNTCDVTGDVRTDD